MDTNFNQSIDELIKAYSLLETSNDTETDWEVNGNYIIEAPEENKIAESKEERDDVTDNYSYLAKSSFNE